MMSLLARKPIPLPEGVEVKKEKGRLVFSGVKGSVSIPLRPEVKIKDVDGAVQLEGEDSRLVGLHVSLIKNAIQGVGEGFKKELELIGVGYKVRKEGDILKFSLGFSHPVEYQIREGVTVTVEDGTRVVVEGADKQIVGQVAAEIRGLRPPEPYKGKGVRYVGEVVKRKMGKAAKVGATTQ